MKTLLFILLVLSGSFLTALADDSVSGSAILKQGVLISITPDKKNLKSPEGVYFSGTIKVLSRDSKEYKNNDEHRKTLLQEFQKKGFVVVGTFPSEAIDVTSHLLLTSTSEDEIKFSFTANSTNASDLNQFSVKIYDQHKNKELLKRLAEIRAKLEQRILALKRLEQGFEKEKDTAEVREYLNKETQALTQLSNEIRQNLNKSENLLAENHYALQVDNLISSSSQISTIINKYKFLITSDVGTVIEGLGTKIKAVVTNLRQADADEDKNNNEEEDDENDLKIADFIFNEQYVFSSSPQKIKNGESVSFEYQTPRLFPVNSNIFSVVLSKTKKGSRSSRIGYLSQKIPIAVDTTAPVWLSESIPSSASLLYVKNLSVVDLKVSDPFGRIDEMSLSAILTGNLVDSSSYNQNVTSKLTQTKIGDGWAYNFSGDINPLAEGLYSFEASVKDFAKNVAQPNPYKVNFRIDTTTPKIVMGVGENTLTNQLTHQVVINVQDLSPTATKVFVNEELQLTTPSTFFTATLNLNIEGANLVKVVSTDAAGNTSTSEVKTIIRDTTPPVLTFISPVQDDFVDGFYFQVSLSANEPVVSAKLNDQLLNISGETQLETNYSTESEGRTVLTAQATDKAGNVGESAITVFAVSRPLNQSLVGLYVDEPNNKIIVKGAVGATRPNYSVEVSKGFFSSETVVADSKGSFMISMQPASSYKVSVYDHRKNETVSYNYELDAENDIMLSGTVRDTDDFPLVNAQVSILGTSFITYTDSNGVFSFLKSSFPNKKVSGDQQIVIDATDVILSPAATPRKFSKTTISITIGIRQSNILQTPIYLAPVYLDGSATSITKQAGGVVNDVHAQGVSLNIPPDSAEFPSNESENLISLQAIPADRATVSVPEWAKPNTVVALEPSGTTFSKPVDVTLPNVNNFYPKTELVIMLMNSKTGRWEVGGAATVSPDGQSVVTKPNQGIRHFSLAYATIAGPNIRPIGAQDKPGVDTFNGALTAQIELPSFKVLGNSFAPKLIYKSSWAKPSALVTNLFDFANTKVDVTLPNRVGASLESYDVKFVNCSWPFYIDTSQGGSGEPIDYDNLPSGCSADPKTFYANIQYETRYTNVTSQIQPERIEATLTTGNLRTNKEVFKNLPHMAAISFGVDLLKNNNTNEYFDTGVYPYQAHYDIYFKELVMGTFTQTYWADNLSAQVTDPKQFEQLSPEKVFGQDLIDSIFVQNYRNSEAGTGWKIAGFQKIANLNSDKIMIEEVDGAISAYTINNTIQTVIEGSGLGVNFASGVALNSWPNVAAASSQNNLEILNLNYRSNIDVSKNVVGRNYALSGFFKGYDFYNYSNQNCYQVRECAERWELPGGNVCVRFETRTVCDPAINYSSCSTHTSSYNFSSKPVSMLNLNGRVIGVDATRHSVFEINNGIANRLLGSQISPPIFFNNYQTQSETQGNAISDYCNSTSGLNCGNQIRTQTTLSGHNACGSTDPNPSEIPHSGSDIIVNGKQSLNTPMGIAASPTPDIVAIADYGFHKVRWLNVATGESGVIAGNGQASDNGNGDLAINASINHPKGLVYDSAGNLYISNESGYIRKVDTNGYISIVAGDPVNGILANESSAREVLFNKPYGLALDQLKSYLYVADTGNNRVVRIDLNTDKALTVAGNGRAGFSGDGRTALEASLSSPTQLGLDENNNLLIADGGNNRIRRVVFQNTSSGILSFLPTTKDHSVLQRVQDGTWVRTYRDGTRVYFNNLGLQISVVDNANQIVSYIYDTQNRLTEVKPPIGASILYSYSGDKLSRITDPANRVTEFNYDFAGNLKSVHFPDNTAKRFEYNASGLMLAETDQKNSRREYQYNAYNRLEKIIQPDGTAVGLTDSGSINLQNFSAAETQPKQYGIGPDKLNDTITDPNGNKTVLAKDFEGYISTIVDAQGRTTSIKRDLEGRPIEITDVDGSITQNTYDPTYGDLIKSKNVTLDITTETQYNSSGQITSQTDPHGKITYKVYDTKKQLIKEIAPDGKYTTYEYNLLALVTKKSFYNLNNELKNQMTYEYNLKGQLIKQTDLNNKFSTYTYDLAGNVLTSTSNINSSTQSTTSYEYDQMNRLTKVTSPKAEITEYTYSPTGELIQITDPKQKITSFEYDFKGKLIKKINPLGQEHHMSYDSNGNLLTEKDPANQLKYYTYNSVNKITQVQTADDLIRYQYNIKDEVTQIANNASTINYIRDAKQRITQESVSGTNYPGHTLNIAYSKNDLRTSLQSNYQNLSYTYNDSYQLTGLNSTSTGSYGFDFYYDDVRRLSTFVRPGSRTEYAFDPGSNLLRIMHISFSPAVIRSSNEYSYDERNYITQKRSLTSVQTYDYDLNGQLITVAHNAEDASKNESFSYDALGNRLTYNGVTSTYDNSGQRIQDDGIYTYVYDANGNIIYKSNKANGISYTFEYSALNQLKIAIVTSTPLNGNVLKTIEYKYDPVGRRILRNSYDHVSPQKSSTKKYYYDGDNIMAELDANNNIVVTYTHSPLRPDDVLGAQFTSFATPGGAASEGQVYAQNAGAVYYLKDHLNTVTDIINGSGQIVQRMDYSAFGVLRSVKDSSGTEVGFESAPVRTSFTYTGREYEPELGMYYYRARYYDPSTGRFLQQDPDPGKLSDPRTFLSKYAYAANNPIMFNDPTGLIFGIDDIIFIAIMAGAGALAEGANKGFSIENILIGALKGIALAGAVIGVASLLGGISGGSIVGAFKGFATPGLGLEIAAGVLAIPAAFGMFDPNADSQTQNYANNFLIAGAIGGLIRAGVGTIGSEFLTGDPGILPVGETFSKWGYTINQADLIAWNQTILKFNIYMYSVGLAPLTGVRR